HWEEVEVLAGGSAFLAREMVREASWLPALWDRDPDTLLDECLSAVHAAAAGDGADAASLMPVLRQARRRAAILIARADIFGDWDVARVTGALSRLADASVQASVEVLVADLVRRGKLPERPEPVTAETCGLIVLGMGKLGAGELNYSSDIDLVLFLDPERWPADAVGEAKAAMIRLSQSLVKMLSERTGDGYVFRTDLRLRPDAGATPPVITVPAAEHYYETLGQNWERMALIKARPIAGDMEAGAAFLELVRPFVWRRSLDFYAVEDIKSIKRQIHAHYGHGALAVAGHDVKLGRGGIREIEFFVQTQQLIGGGRVKALRQRTTLAGLDALTDLGWVAPETRDELAESYVYLRAVEHRIQMMNDEQTHRIPEDDEGRACLAALMGYPDRESFEKALLAHLARVSRHYAGLFDDAPALSSDEGSLVFTGTDDDPETLETLRKKGFKGPQTVSRTIRGWHHGRIPATRTARAREILTHLVPVLVDTMGKTSDPDQAMVRFDRFLSGLPGGVQVFALLRSNPALLELLVEVLGMAPRLGEYLARNHAVLEAVLDPGFFSGPRAPDEMEAHLARAVDAVEGFEGALDAVRRIVKEERFRLGVLVLRGVLEAEEAGHAFADLAHAAVRVTLRAVEGEMERRHGRVPGGAFAVVALGKCGGREMTATSDLDLIFIYDQDADGESDGKSPLSREQYYARLGQRLVSALTVPTAEGELYEVDMRLRPSGRAGPLATQLSAFARYHEESSWTWEKLALTRARVIAAPDAFAARVNDAIREALCTARDAASTCADVREMREKLAAERPPSGIFDIKLSAGGQVDVEFIWQALQLVHAPDRPDLLATESAQALTRLEDAGLLQGHGAALKAAHGLYATLAQFLGVAVEGTLAAEEAPAQLAVAMSRVVGVADLDTLGARLDEARGEVRAAYRALLGGPATE
ncbi:MAG: bifunctional [glutamine synthetase] adenylyltransferase/[glutamine synthetase]-adenylyl-L-tyrosine phosphorylase, partial [Alphaproteobacteria bacterium]|nr:bifunctional [glutamine synthetase] adenylyltransferase/[glutamine synthetase]-adenylyl-L-tyrosine phosphorylase [Alphaproteobacteria bacterium]MDX5367915.1 bifunctional [glutamine synthetase] adenylyltransferase/[glutamine synthetase]-adenylyl-L-tyrosine phosphorylase [Alphaproteobacteria bacterium]MDX5462768.1 bifunctional [glutamine synthetase] adenylyltransferase/[glutamine synthetase]-adenylyl-L-tyrosine phosphorylase [Alphaproteobacteria bacterium]